MFPIFGEGIYNTFVLGLVNLYSFAGIEYIYFLPPFLKKPENMKKILLISIGISALYLLLSVATLLFIFAFFVSTNENMLVSIFSSGMYFILVIAELATVIFLSARLHKMSETTAKIAFILYAFLTGLTFSSIFVVYELTSIMYVFLVCSIIFGVFAVIGATTNIDLSKIGTILLMLLFGIIIVSRF